MPAKAEASNDVNAVQDIVKDISGFVDDLKGFSAQLAKAAAAMKKKPEECKDAAKDAAGILIGLSKASKDFDALAKQIGKSIVK